MAENRDPASALREIRRLLADLLESTEQARMPVAQIMRLLDVVEGGQVQPDDPGHGRSFTRGRDARRYQVEETAGGPVLTEGREGGKSPPFRATKAVYDAVTSVLATAEKPLRFEDIMDRMAKSGPVPPGDFQVRVCIRFLATRQPPLVIRTRSAYHPVSKSLATDAQTAWRVAKT